MGPIDRLSRESMQPREVRTGSRRVRRFYDRLLAKLGSRTVRFGVCFSLQLVPELPLEVHDQLLDAVITEHGVA